MKRTIRHFHFFSGMGGFAKGFNQEESRLGLQRTKWECLGGIDFDRGACVDFKTLTGVPATCVDLFTREQYTAFHGHEPPPKWREVTAVDVRRASRGKAPNVVALSAPCKGFSGLLSENLSKSIRYQALNELAMRGLWLALEAWKDDPPEFFLFENVPRIQTRGRPMVDEITQLLGRYGYAVAETNHDCGELGELAQSRKRFLMVARHEAKVPPFLYEPVKRSLKSVGQVLGRMLLPGDLRAGPMHRVPSLQWKTWMRLAFVTAGADWRSLNKLAVENGFLRDYALTAFRDSYGVTHWDDPAKTLRCDARPSKGEFSVADPRFSESAKWNEGHAYGVVPWKEASNTIAGQQSPGQGYYSVADPRVKREGGGPAFRNVYRVVRWDEVGKAVTGGGHPTSGGVAVADPRTGYGPDSHRNKLSVVPWNGRAGTITGATQVQGGALSIADPRTGLVREDGDAYRTSGHYGVIPWNEPSYAVVGKLSHDNGRGNVADPRVQHEGDVGERQTDQLSIPGHVRGGDGGADPAVLPSADTRLVAQIISADATWHRPFTTLDLACLQGLIEPEEHLELEGLSDRAWRERIGNAVPPPAAKAIAGVIGTTLLLAWSGETFVLGSTPIWVRNVAVGLSVARRAVLQ